MPKVKQETAGKIGLFSAIMIIFGAVVGIGIFFKNKTVFNLNNNNFVGILCSWGISVVIVLCLALSFAEISTCRMQNKNAGLGGWSQMFCRHGFGRYSKVGYPLAFYAINTFSVVFFVGEAILNCFAQLGVEGSKVGGFSFGSLSALYIFIIGGGIFLLLLLLNYFVSKSMGKFSNVVGLIKFIPIGMVILLGIVFGIIYADSGLWHGVETATSTPVNASGSLDVFGMFKAVPAILFSYEGFLVVGNIAGDMNEPRKNVPIAVVLGVVVISLVYVGITIGCITAGTGNVYELMNMEGLNPIVKQFLTYLISIFLFICLIGTLNALVFSGTRGLQAVCEDGTFFKGKTLTNKKPNSPLFAGTIYLAFLVGIWWVITIIPSAIRNTDAIADGTSSVMITFLYIIYGGTIWGGLKNRATHNHETIKFKIFPVAAVIGVLACIFVFSFCGIYQYIVEPVQKVLTGGLSWNDDYQNGWGLFLTAKMAKGGLIPEYLTYKEVMIYFWCFFGLLVLAPFINDWFIKHFDKENQQHLIWQYVEQ